MGLGNILFGDDGIGPQVIKELRQEHLPRGVNAVEAGGSFYNYWELLLKSRHVVAVDSMLGGGAPGTIYLVTPDHIGQRAKQGIQHEVHFLDAVKMAACCGARPEVTIIGVEPKNLDYGLGLSAEVQAQIPKIKEIIRKYFKYENVVDDGEVG